MNQPAAADADTSFWTPRILLSFLLISLIWGSTWIVIKDQIASVPPVWSVSYRFAAASLAMFLVILIRRQPLMLDRRGQFWAILLGCSQFAFNFNFVYGAELYITSGLVAVMFALLMVPNAILGRIFLGQHISSGFVIGSAIAIAGIALLFVREYRLAPVGGSTVFIGIGLTMAAIMSASAANILQASKGAQAHPILTLIAWAMLWGTLFNAAFALVTVGPPVVEMRAAYLAGILYLGVIGSAVTFPIYFGLIREIGAAQAAYTSVIVPIVAMILSTLFEGYSWSLLAASGAVLAIAGLLYAMRSRRARRPRLPI
ncbi:DMT family transporter [Parasphingopyxis lamellibrachiae]|uniref:EamA-like transporter family protein n=1 Tax=Parasphingopyxis lamellibrachiae TaxID=680125 RepID=A0A3D9FGS1_9SPHN|nr:DMT family transporter [Parasphingopyxis lamellibrachiae]RED16747.1 EamA-like transporter family protein [Parasphingopyxis lamellibrachiae]